MVAALNSYLAELLYSETLLRPPHEAVGWWAETTPRRTEGRMEICPFEQVSSNICRDANRFDIAVDNRTQKFNESLFTSQKVANSEWLCAETTFSAGQMD